MPRWSLYALRRSFGGIAQGFRLLWRLKSRPGRPAISVELRQLIQRIAAENPLWGQERIANELRLRLGLHLSPRTVAKYLPKRPPGRPRCDQRWSTFLRNHAKAIVACDFFVAVTATFRLLYVFVVIEHGARRLLHLNITSHPTAPWTLQQLREALGSEARYRYLIHDRDCIFAKNLDESIERLGLNVLKSPLRSPKANAICERAIGTIRQECLDFRVGWIASRVFARGRLTAITFFADHRQPGDQRKKLVSKCISHCQGDANTMATARAIAWW